MASRRLRVESVDVTHAHGGDESKPYSVVTIRFSRKLTPLEVSGVTAVLEGTIK